MPKTLGLKENIFTKPNTISLLRLPILFLSIYFVFANYYLLAAISIALVFLMDWADGYIARKFKEETEFGKVLDEIIDRIVENALFITFAYFQYLPLWMPLLMIMRAIIVDNIVLYYGRNETLEYKKFIRSDLSRGGYAILKAVLFIGLALYPVLGSIPRSLLLALAVIIVLFSLFRGAVKINEAWKNKK